MSKKKPLLIVADIAGQRATEAAFNAEEGLLTVEVDEEKEEPEEQQQLKFMFKCGDDLRQDNLVVQFLKIMDRLWQQAG